LFLCTMFLCTDKIILEAMQAANVIGHLFQLPCLSLSQGFGQSKQTLYACTGDALGDG